jgi:hypothetical protein
LTQYIVNVPHSFSNYSVASSDSLSEIFTWIRSHVHYRVRMTKYKFERHFSRIIRILKSSRQAQSGNLYNIEVDWSRPCCQDIITLLRQQPSDIQQYARPRYWTSHNLLSRAQEINFIWFPDSTRWNQNPLLESLYQKLQHLKCRELHFNISPKPRFRTGP